MPKTKHQKGSTLIEIILAIFLLAVAIPPLLQLFAENAVTGAKASFLPTSTILENGLMEEIKSLAFDELSTKDASGNWSAVLGPDAGEPGNKTLFDDVDDFHGWFQDFGSSYVGYTADVTVDYVSSNNLDTPLTIPSPMPNNWTPSYKRVRITLSYPGLAGSVDLSTIVTEVQSL